MDWTRELAILTSSVVGKLLIGGLLIVGVGGAVGGAPEAGAGHGFALASRGPLPRQADARSSEPPSAGTDETSSPSSTDGGPGERESKDAPVAATVEATNTLQFKPAKVTIRVGEAVRWKNVSAVRHTVTADPEKATKKKSVSLPPGAEPFDSGRISAGGSYEHVFREPGRYRYFCEPHEGTNMRGNVVVKEKSGASS